MGRNEKIILLIKKYFSRQREQSQVDQIVDFYHRA